MTFYEEVLEDLRRQRRRSIAILIAVVLAAGAPVLYVIAHFVIKYW